MEYIKWTHDITFSTKYHGLIQCSDIATRTELFVSIHACSLLLAFIEKECNSHVIHDFTPCFVRLLIGWLIGWLVGWSVPFLLFQFFGHFKVTAPVQMPQWPSPSIWSIRFFVCILWTTITAQIIFLCFWRDIVNQDDAILFSPPFLNKLKERERERDRERKERKRDKKQQKHWI